MHLPFKAKRNQFIRSNGQDTILIKMTWKPKGILGLLSGVQFGKGKTSSMSCALARPYKRIFEEGKPIGRINHVFFKANEWPSHIVGSLCLTPGQRLLFYPGLIERKVNWHYSGKEGFASIKSTGFVDHFTFDRGFRRWHLSILESDGTKKLRLPSYKTKEVSEDTLFWFGITIQDHGCLEITPEEVTLTFPSPPSDSIRRSDLMLKAREGAVFHLVTLNKMPLNKGEFLHFDFFIGPSDLSTEKIPCFVPRQEPIIYGYAQAFKEGTYFRGHPVSLEGIAEKIWVVVSKHIGKVSDKAVITCF